MLIDKLRIESDAVWFAVSSDLKEWEALESKEKCTKDKEEWFLVKIERYGSKECRALRRKLQKEKIDRARNGEQLEVIAEITEKAAEHVLTDWDWLNDRDGKAIKYSKELAREFLQEDEDFLTVVIAMADERDAYRAKIKEQSSKN